MFATLKRLVSVVAMILPVSAGCTMGASKAWVEDSQVLSVSVEGLERLAVSTHNGSVKYSGIADVERMKVVVKCKGGGPDMDTAQEALDAIELISCADSDKGYKLSWKWRVTKKPEWQGEVSYEVVGPRHFALEVQTHNGAVSADDIDGECSLTTHNGAVKVKSGVSPLRVQTHNGRIEAVCCGSEVSLETHNGEIDLNASGSSKLGGRLATHNGSVSVIVGEKTSANVSCSTHNGAIKWNAPAQAKSSAKSNGRKVASGTIGEGGESLVVETYNGSIKIDD